MIDASQVTRPGRQQWRGRMPGLLALVLVALAPAVGFSQAAPYLKGATPWQKSTTGISGLWRMQGYLSSTVNPPRARAAKTVDGQLPPLLPWAAELLEKRLVDAEHLKAFPNTASLCLPQGILTCCMPASTVPCRSSRRRARSRSSRPPTTRCG
jgi:hypothetical protein